MFNFVFSFFQKESKKKRQNPIPIEYNETLFFFFLLLGDKKPIRVFSSQFLSSFSSLQRKRELFKENLFFFFFISLLGLKKKEGKKQRESDKKPFCIPIFGYIYYPSFYTYLFKGVFFFTF